jgi:hypothetical protein|tara:strand:+ start:1993 stop:2754 length:762 start_codon:yes stop_codon:yes gene_type:complete
MQSIGKSLKSAYKICEPDYIDEHGEALDKIMLEVAYGRLDKVDRGSFVHNYHRPYGKLLGPGRENVQTVLEVGVFAGLGLHAWSKFFSNSQIEGVDKSFQYERKIKRLFTHPESDRIKLNWCDTTSIYHLAEHFNHHKYHHYFDIIFDDGNHFASGQKATVINLWDFLKPGGWYMIEDVTDVYEPPDKILEYVNELSERGHEVGWFEFPKQNKDDHDSNLIAIKKSYLTTTNIPSENPDAPWLKPDIVGVHGF